MKESFILYNSFYEPIKALKNEQLGKLLRAIFNYTINGEITQDDDIIVAFMFIKNQIDIDTEKWQDEKEKRSEAGKKGMASRWGNKDNNVITSNNKDNNVINVITKITDNVNENVNVNDNVIIKENIQKKFFEDLQLNNLFLEFLDLRKKLKCKNTDHAITLLTNKLNEYDDATKIEMLNNAIMNSWKSVYPIKEFKQNKKADEFKEALMEVYDGTIEFQ